MAEDRSEQPTGRRLKKAREKGQIARSRELGQAVQLLGVIAGFWWAGSLFISAMGRMMVKGLSRLDGGAALPFDTSSLQGLAIEGGGVLAIIVGPVAAISAVAIVVTATAQGGWNFAPEALQPRLSNLSPVNGIKRLGFSRAWVDLAKTLVSLVIVTVITWRLVSEAIAAAPGWSRVPLITSSREGWELSARLLRDVAIAFLILAVLDYGVQRWRHLKSLRMTKQEVKDERKMEEGNPETKSRVRRLQFQMARRRMLAAVPKATVVITNPTEYAVALDYARDRLAAPVVVAKGRGTMAARIKAIARHHGVPTVENVPLAQALYRTSEVGDAIPGELFEAVAEVLAYLVRLKRLAL